MADQFELLIAPEPVAPPRREGAPDPFAEYRMGGSPLRADLPARSQQPVDDPLAQYRFGAGLTVDAPVAVAHLDVALPLAAAAPAQPGGAGGNGDQAHQVILDNAQRLVSDINRSNSLDHAPRLLAETTLRVLSAFQWGGTGITQHPSWQQSVEARRRVVQAGPDASGTIPLTPQDWANAFTDVQERRDSLNRKWGNCAEQAASLAHVIHGMINEPGNAAMAGLQVRQAYGDGHSWVEVRNPSGQITVYDPWARQTGPLQAMPASFRDGVRHTPWFGRVP